MKVGDLVIMIEETVPNGETRSVGIIIDDDCWSFPGGKKRIGVLWNGESQIDYEPRQWLEVISECR